MPEKNDPTTPGSLVSNIIHEIKESLRTAPHTLEEIKRSLNEVDVSTADFVSLLERHHDFLQESGDILLDHHVEGRDKRFHLRRFLCLIEMHGKAEQEVLYTSLMNNRAQEARLEGLVGQDEHDIAFQLSDELHEMDFENRWTEEIDAKAKVIAVVVANHIKEEEEEMFPLVRMDLSDEELRLMTGEYVHRCKIYLDLATARKPKSILMT